MRRWALLEQALLSLVNFGLALLLARILDKAAWGTYSLGFVLMLFAQGFQRALVSIPIATMTADDPTLSNTILFWRSNNLRLLAYATVCMLLASALWQLLLPDKWIATAIAIAAVMVPGFFMQEFWRRILIQTGQIKTCAIHAIIYVALIALSTLLLYGFSFPPLAWALGVSSCALAAGLLMSRQFTTEPSAHSGQVDLKPRIAVFGKWAILSHVAYSAYNTGIQIVLSVMTGAAAMGSFAAVRNLVQPVNTVIGAIDSIDKPRASRAFASGGYPAMFLSLRKTLLTLAILGGAYLLAGAAFGGIMIEWLYNAKYGAPWAEVWLWCLVAAGMLLAQPTESGLYITRHPKALFQNRVISAMAGLGTALMLVPSMGVSGAIVALAIGWLCSALLASYQLYRFARSAKLAKEN